MFGYVIPCKMELKIKDYEKFKSYYCGLCKTIKKDYGNLPRFVLNYDMTFLAILIDGIENDLFLTKKEKCIVHPLHKKNILETNDALHFAAFCNIAFAYYKMKDDALDEGSLKDKLLYKFMELFINKFDKSYEEYYMSIGKKLNSLYLIEVKDSKLSLDEFSHPFGDLIGYTLSITYKDLSFKNELYNLGYNLGKWIYLIDAWDDLRKDMETDNFNPINTALNKEGLNYENLFPMLKDRISFSLINCGSSCLDSLNKLELKKNRELLYNIIQFGLMERMDKIFRRHDGNEKSL